MKIYDYTTNTNITLESVKTGMQLRVEGTPSEVNTFLSKFEYETVAEGHETDTEKRVYIQIKSVKLAKYTVSFNTTKYESEDKYSRELINSNYFRTLDFNLTITSEDEDTAYYIFTKISSYMEAELKEYGFEFARCTGYGEVEANQFVDTASINFEHGSMAEIKKAVMTAYKEAKKLRSY